MPSDRTIITKVNEVRSIVEWAFNQPLTVKIECEVRSDRYRNDRRPRVGYHLYIGSYVLADAGEDAQSASFGGDWKQMLSLVEWLKLTVAPKQVRYLDR